MGETIKIQGNLEDIFDCVNFYQNLSVVGSVSIEDLKKSYIDMYLAEYRENFHEGRKQLLEKRKKDLDIRNSDNTVEVVSSVPTTEEVNHGNILGEANERDSKDFEEVEHGINLDEVDIEEVNLDEVDIDEVKTVPSKRNFEEVEHGIMLDTFEEVSNDDAHNVVEKSENNFEEVEHGIILDGIINTETVEEKGIEDLGNTTEKTVEEKNDSFDDFVWEDELKLKENDEEEISQKESIEDIEYRSKSRRERFGEKISLEDLEGDIDEDGYSKENKPHSSRFKDYEERDRFRNRRKYRGRYKDRERYFEEDYVDRKSELDETTISRIQEPKEGYKPEKKKVKSYSSIIDENIGERPTLEYKNVRDYVKKHSGCSIDDVCQYFTRKDVNKALMNVKIVKKKNKLYVV